MIQPSLRQWNLPIVAIACLGCFILYVLLTTGYQSLTCERLAPGSVQCEASHTYLFGAFNRTDARFSLEDVTVASELSDRTPRGGVRFRHALTLEGRDSQFAPDAFQSPLSGAAIKAQILAFIGGEGPLVMTFERSAQGPALARCGLMALLLSVVAWGFWHIRWPRSPAPTPHLELADEP